MKWIKLSDYSHIGGFYERYKEVHSEMEEVEKSEAPWGVEIDKDDMIVELWYFFLPDNHQDYEFLADIIVTGGSKYHAIDGWLLNDKDELIFALKSKRTLLPTAAISAIGNCYNRIELGRLVLMGGYFRNKGHIWNRARSSLIRDNLHCFLTNNSHRDTFEKILLLYPKSIIETLLFEALNIHGNCQDLPVERIVISDDIIHKTYGLADDDLANFPEAMGIKNLDGDKYYPIIKTLEDWKETLKSFEIVLLGEYYFEEKKIVLYVKAMTTVFGKTGEDLDDLFIATFAHELVHAYQYQLNDKAPNHPVILESLASYFEFYLYNEVLDNPVFGDELAQTWKKHSVLIYPYSGAKKLTIEKGQKHFSLNRLIRSLRRKKKFSANGIEREWYDFNHLNNLTTTKLVEFFELFKTSPEIAESLLLGETLDEETKGL